MLPEILNQEMVFGDHLDVENLNAEVINGLNWNEFMSSVVTAGKDNEINGKLSI